MQTNFLNIKLNLKSRIYLALRKPSDRPLHIHCESSYSPVIKKQLPFVLSDRLSQVWCNQEEFTKGVPEYEEAMHTNKYTGVQQYNSNSDPINGKARKRSIVWFNPPYSEHPKTTVGRPFLRLRAKHFPSLHHLCKSASTIMSKLTIAVDQTWLQLFRGITK